MSRNTLYLIIGLLATAVAIAAIYYFYQQAQRPSLQIRVDEQGIAVN